MIRRCSARRVVADRRRALVIVTELGEERLCPVCLEFWPMDEEFWYFLTERKGPRKGERRVMGRCKACWSDRYHHEAVAV